jgi:hypothetical protein
MPDSFGAYTMRDVAAVLRRHGIGFPYAPRGWILALFVFSDGEVACFVRMAGDAIEIGRIGA